MAKAGTKMIKRLAVFFAALVFVIVAVWVGNRVIQPVDVPPAQPLQERVQFNPRVDIRAHPLFQQLQSFVTGDIVPENMGKPIPFETPGTVLPDEVVTESRLATISPRSLLSGTTVMDIARGIDGSMLQLEITSEHSSATAYAITSNRIGSDPVLLASGAITKTAQDDTGDVIPYAIAQDSKGTIWVLSFGRSIGYIEVGHDLVWLPKQNVRPTNFSSSQILVDGTDRVWIHDAEDVFVGGKDGFRKLDLKQELSEQNVELIRSQMEALPEDLKPLSVPIPELVDSALHVRSFFAMPDGGVTIITQNVALIYPGNRQSRPKLINGIPERIVPAVVTPSDVLWGKHMTDSSWAFVTPTSTNVLTDDRLIPELSRNVGNDERLYTIFGDRVFTFDYTSDRAFVWSTTGSTWTPKVLVPGGDVSIDDSFGEIVVDGDGNLWVRSFYGTNVYVITSGAELTLPTL